LGNMLMTKSFKILIDWRLTNRFQHHFRPHLHHPEMKFLFRRCHGP
jgi:hypothetical protein